MEEGKENFEESVLEDVKKYTDEKGKLSLPEEVKKDGVYAHVLRQTKKQLDTQKAFTKVSQEKARISAELAVLKKEIGGKVNLDLTQDQQEYLEELKDSDPYKWREELDKLELQKKQKIEEEIKNAQEGAIKSEEIAFSNVSIADRIREETGIDVLYDGVLEKVPEEFVQAYKNNVISFEEFAYKVVNLIQTPKVVGNTELPKTPNLSEYGGTQQNKNYPKDKHNLQIEVDEVIF